MKRRSLWLALAPKPLGPNQRPVQTLDPHAPVSGRPLKDDRLGAAGPKLEALAQRYALSADKAVALRRLTLALAEERKPPTTVSDPPEAADVHIADSLAGLEVEALARAERIVDIGAGAGFPGLALAAVLPDSAVDLLESNRRKCEVIGRLAHASEIVNAHARASRAEEWPLSGGFVPYHAATARAVAPLAALVEYAAPLLVRDGVLVAWKGRTSGVERGAGRCAAEVLGMTESAVLSVRPYPGSGTRTLYVYSKVSRTPERFPRRPGMARKRPLA